MLRLCSRFFEWAVGLSLKKNTSKIVYGQSLLASWIHGCSLRDGSEKKETKTFSRKTNNMTHWVRIKFCRESQWILWMLLHNKGLLVWHSEREYSSKSSTFKAWLWHPFMLCDLGQVILTLWISVHHLRNFIFGED